MAKRRVLIQEVWLQAYDVEAATDEEAIDLVKGGTVYSTEDGFEFSHQMSSEYWTVEVLSE